MKTNNSSITKILARGVEEVIVKEHLEKRLASNEKLRIKFGIDPTGAEIHLGHTLPLRKLRHFQEAGHTICFIIGDFTARIGDPSGRNKEREILTKSQIESNFKDYVRQAGKVLDMKNLELHHNSEWFDKKGIDFVLEITSKFTVMRMLERDDFQKRIKSDVDISMMELLYPLMQGYDSVALDPCDVEIGGTDQKFNLLTARKVQKRYGKNMQDIMTIPLLVGLDGKDKMSKSKGNYIAVDEKPNEMFAKIMSIPDSLLWNYFELLTDIETSEISAMKEAIEKENENPKNIKVRLAKDIVTQFHSKSLAITAENEFEKVFGRQELPSKIPSINKEQLAINKDGKIGILDLLNVLNFAPSKTEARRLVDQNSVRVNDTIINDWKKNIQVRSGMIVQVGKRKFIQIK